MRALKERKQTESNVGEMSGGGAGCGMRFVKSEVLAVQFSVTEFAGVGVGLEFHSC